MSPSLTAMDVNATIQRALSAGNASGGPVLYNRARSLLQSHRAFTSRRPRLCNNVANAQAYFEAIKHRAGQRSVMTYYFEAIDEPWKSNQNASVPPIAPWQGSNGAEGHYGIRSPDPGQNYVPKFPVS